MDERQKNIVISAMAKVLILVYIVLLILCVTKLVLTHSIFSCLFELIFIIAVPVLVIIYARGERRITFPMSIAGLAVKPENTQRALIGRLKAYIMDSLQYSVVVALLIGASDIWQAYRNGSLAGYGLNGWLDAIGTILVQFIGFFIAFFAMDYFMYEYKARKYSEQKRRDDHRRKATQPNSGE